MDNAQPSIQSAINEAVAGHGDGVVVVPGKSTLLAPLEIKAASGYCGVSLVGARSPYRANHHAGASLIADFTDRSAIEITGARRVLVSGVVIQGKCASWIANNNLGFASAAFDDTDAQSWIDPSLAIENGRYAPYSGISVDPFGGTGSSVVQIEKCHIQGFVVGVSVQPSDFDGNGDFVSVSDSQIEQCVYGVSAGNSQSRCGNIINSQIEQCHTAIVTTKHGRQIGKFGGLVFGSHFGACINIIDIDAGWANATFVGCYGESLHRLGSIGGRSGTKGGIVFDGCELNFAMTNPYRGIPATWLDGGRMSSPVLFRGGKVTMKSLQVATAGVRFDGTRINEADVNVSSPLHYKRATDWAAAPLPHPGDMPVARIGNPIRGRAWNTETGLELQRYELDGLIDTGQPQTWPRWGCALQPSGHWSNLNPKSAIIMGKPSVNWSVSGRTLTATHNQFASANIGDVIMCDETLTIFVISEVQGNTVFAVAVNNWRSAQTEELIVPPQGGAFFWFKTIH